MAQTVDKVLVARSVGQDRNPLLDALHVRMRGVHAAIDDRDTHALGRCIRSDT